VTTVVPLRPSLVAVIDAVPVAIPVTDAAVPVAIPLGVPPWGTVAMT
jgi:hypothetical protein